MTDDRSQMSEDRGRITEVFEWGMWNGEFGMGNVEFGMGNAEWGMRNVEAESIAHAVKDKDIG